MPIAVAMPYRRTVLLAWIACTLPVGCRTYMSYNGQPLDSTATAQQVIYRVLDQQPGSKAAIDVEVTDERFRLLRARSNFVLGTHGVHGTAIYYASIGDMRLSKKGKWFAVTIFSTNDAVLIHVFTPDQKSAERFIDALETMRRSSGTQHGSL